VGTPGRQTGEELDSLLGGLEADTAKVSTDAPKPPPLQRPPSGPYKGRTPFPDLFAAEASAQPTAAVRGGPEEKIEYFREKLRRAEAQIARFREAWQAREWDLDSAEVLIAEQKKRADESTAALQQVQLFLEKKKEEFEAYSKKVTQAFADKDASEKKLREELAALRQQIDGERREIMQSQEQSEHEVQLRDEAVKKLKEAIASQRRALEERDVSIANLEGRVADALEAAQQGAQKGAAHAAEAAAAKEQIEAREVVVRKLKETLKQALAKIAALEEQVAAAKAAPAQGEHLQRIKKALGIAKRFTRDLEISAGDLLEGSDVLDRLGKALDIAHSELEQLEAR
jgi:chromosome segregation ATPase